MGACRPLQPGDLVSELVNCRRHVILLGRIVMSRCPPRTLRVGDLKFVMISLCELRKDLEHLRLHFVRPGIYKLNDDVWDWCRSW